MGKKFLIYLREGIEEEFNLEANKSELVQRLLKRHYEADEEAIRSSLLDVEEERAKLMRRLDNIKREAKRKQKREEGDRARKKSAMISRKMIEDWKEDYKKDKIDSRTYHEAFEKGGKFYNDI